MSDDRMLSRNAGDLLIGERGELEDMKAECDRLREKLSRAENHRIKSISRLVRGDIAVERWQAAEATIARLREALEWIRDLPAISGRPITELLDEIRERARAALAGEGER